MLVEALATSLIPSQQDDWITRQNKAPSEEERQFLEEALEQIERVLRRDEWTNSYQNVWTIAGLDAKQRLMKAEVIPKRYPDFAQYLLDGTLDLIRIKAFDALVDLGALMDHTFFTFFLYCLTTDRSPYVRKQLIQSMARGLAAIAFGEHSRVVKDEPAADDADPLLLIQDSAEEVEARKQMFARRENIDAALKALRKEMEETYAKDDRHFSTAMRKALDHPALGRDEVESLLDLAAMMFEEARSWILTLNLPKAWKVERPVQKLSDRLLVHFKSYYRTKPKGSITPPPAPSPAPEVKKPAPLARTSSIKIHTKAATPRRPSVTLPQITEATPGTLGTNGHSLPAKRARVEKEDSGSPAPKRPKTESQPSSFDGEKPWKKRRMVTLKTGDPSRLAVLLGQQPSASPNGRTALPTKAPKEPSPAGSKDSITAKPARKPLPSGGDGVRRPLPNGSGSAMSPPSSQSTPKVSLNTNVSSASSSKAGSPPTATPVSAKPKIKIIRKPSVPQAQPNPRPES
ncbi:hypothetical protein ACCO45_006577 [Purpureocillium lilacinum]|uniref:Uncharacterized protein n=1 Tax=Purpureocillium lilacinum TaxID=33203 RepID=A0ACC4DSY7_PURLI